MEALKNRKYIVTGGARGIGLAFCQAIVDAGGRVAIFDRLPEPHPDCTSLLDIEGNHYFTCDVSSKEALEPVFEQAVAALGGRIHGCVTAAGIGTDKPFLDLTFEDFNKVVSVNQAGTFLPVQMTVKHLMQREPNASKTCGSIVMVASRAASGNCPGHLLSVYGGTKGFVKSFGLQLGHELARFGIRVNCISPGYVATDLNTELAKVRPEVQHYFNEAPPMKRIGQATDIAGGLIYLLSDASSYVTGIDLPIDGGMSTGNGLTR